MADDDITPTRWERRRGGLLGRQPLLYLCH